MGSAAFAKGRTRNMAAFFNTSELNSILDYSELIAKAILFAYGQRLDNDPIAGWGDGGIALNQFDLENAFLTNTLDLEFSNAIGPALYQLRAQSTASVAAANYFSDLFSRIGQVIQGMAVGPNVIALDQYLTYYNVGAGGTNQALQSPYVRWVMESLGMNPNRANFCYVAYTAGNHVGAQIGGVFSAGSKTVDTAKFVGGMPRLKFATFDSNNGAVTVTGECWNPATQAIEVGKTWITTGGTFTAALEERVLIPGGASPAPANALMTKATAMGGVNAGNRFEARLYPPTGRNISEWVV